MIIAATGHRPHKLGGYGPHIHTRLLRLARSYLEEREKPDAIISGMALGWDMAWAMAGLELGIPLVAAVPFDRQESRWPLESQRVHRRLLAKAGQVHVISPGPYATEKFERRNEWMVDHADRLVALGSGAPGGTSRCIAYAQMQGKPVDNLWPLWCDRSPSPSPATDAPTAFTIKPTRVQYRRGEPLRSPNGLPTQYVGRPTWAGNPFKVGTPETPTREDAVRQYEAHVETHPELVRRIKAELRGKNLACWCPLDGRPCHADVQLRIANS